MGCVLSSLDAMVLYWRFVNGCFVGRNTQGMLVLFRAEMKTKATHMCEVQSVTAI